MTAPQPRPRLTVVGPYIRPGDATWLDEWLPFATGFAVIALLVVEWWRRGSR